MLQHLAQISKDEHAIIFAALVTSIVVALLIIALVLMIIHRLGKIVTDINYLIIQANIRNSRKDLRYQPNPKPADYRRFEAGDPPYGRTSHDRG